MARSPGIAAAPWPRPGPASPSAPPLAGYALTIGLFVAIVVVLFAISPVGTCLDFTVFHRAGERYLHGEDLYRLGDGHFAYKYAPTVAALLAPLGLLPLGLGWVAMNVLSLLALVRVLRWVAVRLGRSPGRFEQALLLAMAAPWYGHLFWLGQSDGLILLLLVESEEQSARRPLLAGALWALACLVKPPVAVVVLVALVLRQWKRIAGLVVALPLWLIAGIARYGPERGFEQLRGWRMLLTRSTPDLLCNEWNQSAWAVTCTYLAPLGSPRFLPALAALALLLVAAGLAAVARVGRVDAGRGRFLLAAFGFYLGAFLSPLGWNTNLVLAIPLACAVSALAVSGATPALRRTALAAALATALINCADLLLWPLHLWADTALTLLLVRQYAIAGLVTVAAALGGLVLHARAAAAPGATVNPTATAPHVAGPGIGDGPEQRAAG